MMEPSKANTRDRWEARFHGTEWADVEGSKLTETFAYCIVEALPIWVHRRLERASILDWGCALGEGVGVFRDTWPRATVAGEDFSIAAIEAAIEEFGGTFIHDPDGAILTPVDVLITSNVLEHIVEPLALMREQMVNVADFYILLVPFEEDLGSVEAMAMTPQQRSDAGHTHVQRFDLTSFPLEITDEAGRRWDMRVRKTDVVPGVVWPGRQMLCAYEGS